MLHIDAKVLLFFQVFVVVGLPLFLWRVVGLGRLFPLPIIQILAGIVLGPSIFGAVSKWIADKYGVMDAFQFMFKSEITAGISAIAGVETLASVAVVLFIFLAGCEADRSILKKSAGVVARIGMTGVFLPWMLGALAAYTIVSIYPTVTVLGPQQRPVLYSIAFGLCMAVSALPVLVIVLRELGINTKPIGSIAIAIGGIDDVLLWTSLSVLLPLAAAVSGGGGIWAGAATAIAGGLATFCLLYFVIAPFMEMLIAREAPERILMSTVIVTLFFAALLTEVTGLHAAIGAMLTGLMLPEKLRHMAQDRLDSPVTLLLLPFLFLSTGLKTNFAFGDPTVWVILAVALIVCVGGKFVGVTLPAYFSGQSLGFSMTLGALLQCKGLMEIVIVTVLYQKELIGSATFSALILAALVSTAMTVPLTKLCMRVFGDAATDPGAAEKMTSPGVGEPVVREKTATGTIAPEPEAALPAGPRLAFATEIGTLPLPADKSELVLGRHSGDDIRINDVRVSRHHAKLRMLGDGRYEISNLTAVRSEPNPMTVNGVDREQAVLSDGDVVTLGGVPFTFHAAKMAEAA